MKPSISKLTFSVLILIALIISNPLSYSQNKPKKIYLTYVLHGNMNYDRYVKSVIWRDFPVIYDGLLDFLDDNPDFKGQIQLSGQTFLSLKQTAPEVIEHALKLQNRGQLNFTGTFYSEPVNVTMDGETNFRCARLGTSIIEKAVGSTDGYYLQERAYHAQLPWILKNSNVSWVPVITGDAETFPFRLRGLDGSLTVCVPTIARNLITNAIKEAPENSLLLIEGDYEIPQSFTEPYKRISELDKAEPGVEVEWITVKDYISRIGVNKERFIDGTAKAMDINHGSYSRWTADPLDIIVQDYANKAMADFRVATIMSSLSPMLYSAPVDEPVNSSRITFTEDPVAWDIEHASDYPSVEPEFLKRNREVTLLSRAEHLLLWAVNSDSRGWYPLYERRRERINSFSTSSAISGELVNRGLDIIAKNIKVKGYDRYFIVLNAQQAGEKTIKLETDRPYDIYSISTGQKLKSTAVKSGNSYSIDFTLPVPAYSYTAVGLRRSANYDIYKWTAGNTISNGAISLTANNNSVILERNGEKIEMSLDTFLIRSVAELTLGNGDNEWRKPVPHGSLRTSTRTTLHPQLRIEKQIDWLVHMIQTYTLLPDRVVAELTFDFAHPTLIRKNGNTMGQNFNPEGLTLIFRSGKPGTVFYDIPFAISPHTMKSLSYYCPLSTSILQHDSGNGFMVTTGTGEQGFYADSEKGIMGLYMGASTSSGPIRNVGMTFVSRERVDHDPAWYSEPFHGTYNHRIMIYPFTGTWQENHAPAISKSFTKDVFIREFYPSGASGKMAPEKSLFEVSQPGIEVTSMEYISGILKVRLNDKEGKECDVDLTIGGKTKRVHMPAHGIIDVDF